MAWFKSPARQAALEAAVLRELASTWDELQHNHFKGTLRRPVLALTDGEHRLGTWSRSQRTIAIARGLVFGQPWSAVREVLKHEMAHQFVDEVLGIHDETAHGPAFTRVCQAHGIDARAAGLPAAVGGETSGGPDRVLRRIMRLLALAESPNVHEAQAAMNEAQRLMLLHNIDSAPGQAADGYSFRHVGAVKARTDVSQKVLAGMLSRHFFVSVIWIPSYLAEEGRRGHVLELCGTPSNLAVAAYVHGFLTETAERLWRAHKRAASIRSDRERRRFLAGVMAGFDEKLAVGERRSQREGLVCHADAERDAYLRRRYPRRSSRTGQSIRRTQAYEHGRAAGKQIVLQRPLETGSAGPRLLPAWPRR
jgi:hypothetical protein